MKAKPRESLTSSENNKLSYLNSYDELKQTQSCDNTLPRGVRWFIFTVFLILNILMNVDHGTIPAATDDIRKDLNIDDNDLGIFGSLVFVGNILGALISFTLINTFNRKYLLIISLILNGVCLYCFTITQIIWILFFDRVAVGVFQSFIAIYLPVWCDQFGIRNKKTIMISLIQVAAPLGVVVGYFLTTLIRDIYGWSFSFVLQALIIGSLVLILVFIPGQYFSATLVLRNSIIVPPEENNSKNQEADRYKETLISEKKIENDSHNNSTVMEDSSLVIPKKNVSICKNLCFIFQQKIFVFCVLTLSSLFFVITAVQYWASDYLQSALGVEDKHLRLLCFSVVCVTSPTLGVLIGGLVTSATGGYESKHSILVCWTFALAAACFSIPVPLVNDMITFTVYLWLVLFFGGAILSPLTGIVITTLPRELAGSANSITSFFSNLLGYLPAPFVYGIINNIYKTKYKRLAMLCVMYYSFSGVLFLSIAMFFRYKYFNLIKNDYLIAIQTEKKLSLVSKRGSRLSGAIGQVFGNYSNIDEGREILLLDEQKDENSPQSKRDIEKNRIQNKLLCQRKNTEEDDYNQDSSETEQKKTAGFVSTPEFNMIHHIGGNIEETGFGGPISHATFQPFNKDEESLFGEKKVITVNSAHEMKGNEIDFEKEGRVCNSQTCHSLI